VENNKLAVHPFDNDGLNKDNKFPFVDNLNKYRGKFLNFVFDDTP
jgi:hypothetical protein